MDCSANDGARATAIRATRKWGRIVFLGEGGRVEFNPSPDIIHDQKTIYGSWVTSTWLMEELVERLVRWNLHPADLVTHRFALDKVDRCLCADGLRQVRQGRRLLRRGAAIMKITRRSALGMLAAAPVVRHAAAQTPTFDIHKGPFAGTRESLKAYHVPEWFRDAKFGIWAHWGPQSAPEQGDWYARRMYIEGEAQYKWHKEHFGPQSKVGFKDVIPTFKGEKFDPENLVGLYKKAGAKYFVSMGVHHDNFDMWNSRHTRWNAVNMGPKKDVVGLFRQAALKHGLKFGVSEHLWISYKWWGVSHDSDKSGQYAGVPYDGTDPKNFDLYHDLPKDYGKDFSWDDAKIPDSWKKHWFDRIKDLVDQHQPDLLYTDGALPFEEYGLNLVAHLYNMKPQAVYTSKRKEDCETGTCALDFERGLPDGIHPNPWQTDTCVRRLAL